jgi:putative hydrolase of the HAD superfamily
MGWPWSAMTRKLFLKMAHAISNTVFVFDLDDTLYSERSFEESGIRSAYQWVLDKANTDYSENFQMHLLENKSKWVDFICSEFGRVNFVNKESILHHYHSHIPEIFLYKDSEVLLSEIRKKNGMIAVVTDGKSITQRNKLRALGIADFIDQVYISEEVGFSKPSTHSFLLIQEEFPDRNFIYFGDNPKKDFVAPNELGWKTYGRRWAAHNVHQYALEALPQINLPNQWFSTFEEIAVN